MLLPELAFALRPSCHPAYISKVNFTCTQAATAFCCVSALTGVPIVVAQTVHIGTAVLAPLSSFKA